MPQKSQDPIAELRLYRGRLKGRGEHAKAAVVDRCIELLQRGGKRYDSALIAETHNDADSEFLKRFKSAIKNDSDTASIHAAARSSVG